MNIFLIRHAKAEVASHLKKDIERDLTDEGKKILMDSIILWKSAAASFDLILTSPYRRAVHTAEIIADSYNYKNEIIKDSSLAPGSRVNSIIHLGNTYNGERIAFIGHQPDIGFQVSSLISNSEMNLKISPASIVNIYFEHKPKVGRGILNFLFPPVIISSNDNDNNKN